MIEETEDKTSYIELAVYIALMITILVFVFNAGIWYGQAKANTKLVSPIGNNSVK